MDPHSRIERSARRIVQACAALSGGAASAVGVGWIIGHWAFATLGPDYIPMAPSTAWLFVLLNGALLGRARWPDRRGTRALAYAAIAITGVVSLLVAGGALLKLQVPLETWLTSTTATVEGIPVGRMSLLTAGTFVIAAAALWLEVIDAGRHWVVRHVAAALASAVLLISLIVVLSYAAGAPLLYSSEHIPMAMLTAGAFAGLGLGLLVAAVPDNWVLNLLAGEPRGGAGAGFRRFEWALLTAFLVLIVGLGTSGFLYLQRQMADARAAVWRELNAIADLKVEQIAQWRQERIADATFFSRAAFVARDVQAFLDNPSSETARAELVQWMTPLKSGDRYAAVALFDPQLGVRLSLPTEGELLGPRAREHVAAALRSSGVTITDLHGEVGWAAAHLDLVFPVFASPGSSAIRGVGPIAVILLRIDPSRFLYPLVQSWPTPSPTAETLLVRRDGDEVLYLNELRHQKDTALSLRRPIDQPHLPAAMGARGEVGIAEGLDYRGARVLAAVRAVSDSPWFMVAKVDQEEIYAPIRHRAWTTSAILTVLALAATLGLVVLWQQQNAQLLNQELAVQREMERLNRLYAALSQVNQAIVRAQTREELFQEVCFAIVRHGGFKMAWVGWHDQTTHAVVPVAQCGDEGGYLHEIRVYADDRPEGRGPTGTALCEGRPYVCNDWANDPRVAPWREAAARQGFRASAAVPIRLQGEVCGALTVYAVEPQFFGQKETTLLEEAAADISFALDNLEKDRQRQQAEEKLRQSEVRYRELFDSIPSGVAVYEAVDDGGDFVFKEFNRAAERIEKMPREAVLGKRVTEVFPGVREMGLLEVFQRVWRTGQSEHLPVAIYRDQRIEGWRENYVYRLPSGEVVAVYEDLTERKQAEEKLLRMESELAHVARLSLMGEMAAGIAHELNQPLYSILNFSKACRNVLADEASPNLDALREWIEEIDASAVRAGDFVSQLRGFVRRGAASYATASINEIVAESAGLVAFEVRHSGAAVTFDLHAPDPLVHADRVRIQQVMVNLLRNAFEAMENQQSPPPGVVVRTRVLGGEVEVSVEDTGPGLPSDAGLQVFDPFVTTKAGGLGMGLAISRSIVEAHGGRLWAASNPDRGATFRFLLPLASPEGANEQRADRVRGG